jgi:hypothetical protein
MSLGVKNMSTVKRWIITGASFGGGLAIVLALIIGGYLWYESKPRPPKPWDNKAITANYDFVDTEGEKNTIVFYYTLQNNTDFDYRIVDASSVTLMSKLEKTKSLSGTKNDDFLKIDFPILLPAKQRARFAIHFNYPYEKKSRGEATQDEREKYRKELAAFLKEKAPNLNGFALFDELNRYQVDFARGW